MNGNSNYRFKHCCHPNNTLIPIQPMAPPMPYPPVLPLLTPPPPPPPLYPFNQHHFNNGNGSYYWKNGYSYPGVNQQLMTNQENVVWQQRANDGITKNENKKLKEKDRQIEELLAKVASLETTARENAQLRAKLHEFGDLESKKQDLELREFNLEISELKRAEADSLKEQLQESEKSRMKAEEMVRMWESCYYHDIDKILKQNEEKLLAQRASDETFWKRQLDQMARKHEAEKNYNETQMQRLEKRMEESEGSESGEYWLELDEKDRKIRGLEDENVDLRMRVRRFEEKYYMPGNGNDHYGREYDKDEVKMGKEMRRMEKKIEKLEDDLDSEKDRRRAAEEALDDEKKAIPQKVKDAMAKERRQYELKVNEKESLLRMATSKVRELESGNSRDGPTNEAMLHAFVEVQVVRTSNQILEKKIKEMEDQMAAKEGDWEWERNELRSRLAIFEAHFAAHQDNEEIVQPQQQPLPVRRRQPVPSPRPTPVAQQANGGAAPQSPALRRRQAAPGPGPSGTSEPEVRRSTRKRVAVSRATF